MARVAHDNRTMRTNQRFRFVAIVGLVVALLAAGISLAAGASDTPEDPEPTTCEPLDDGDVVDGDGDETVVDDGGDGTVVPDDKGDEPTHTEGDDLTHTEGDDLTDTEGDDLTDTEGEGDEPTDTEDCDDATVEEDDAEAGSEGDDVQAAAEPSEEHVRACIDETEDTELAELDLDPTVEPVPGEKHGLENAITRVFWNCVHHENLGLLNALDHLTDNLDAKLQREELRAERAAEREAAKAAREAAREAAKAARDAAHEAAKAARDAAKVARAAAHGS